MKILVLAAFYHPYRGGYSRSIEELLVRLVRLGHQITVVTCNTEKAALEEIKSGIKIIRIPCWNPLWLNASYPIVAPWALVKIWRQLKQENYQIIYTQTRFYPTTLVGFVFAKINKIPVVHTEQGSQHTVAVNPLVFIAGWLIDHTFGWLVCRFSDAVVGVSHKACDFCRHLGAKEPILIYNSINVDLWRIESLAGREITFVGRLIYAKGVQDLIKAAALMKSKIKNQKSKINIVGDGPYRPYLERLTSELGLQNYVEFWGELDRDGIKEVFQRTAIFVNPSYSEGLPVSVLEAGAAGLPMVAADAGGTRDILTDDNYGLLFKPREVEQLCQKIEFLLNDEALRQKIGKNVKNHIQLKFNPLLCAASTEKLFLETIARWAKKRSG